MRNEVIGRPSWVTKWRGVVAIRPEMLSDSIETFLERHQLAGDVSRMVRAENGDAQTKLNC
jgi:hypothetical protein